MKRVSVTTLLAVLLLAGSAPSRAQTSGQQSELPLSSPISDGPTGETAVDRGRIEGGTFTSDFFGLSFALPQGWVAQDAAARKAVIEEGKKIVNEGASARRKAGLEASLERTSLLISVSKYDPTTPRPAFNASLLCYAERAPSAIVKTGRDYIDAMLRGFTGTGAKMELLGPVRSERLGGVAFTAADIKVTAGPYVVMQKYYVTVMKGYALVFTYSYVDEADVKTFDELIKSVKFK